MPIVQVHGDISKFVNTFPKEKVHVLQAMQPYVCICSN